MSAFSFVSGNWHIMAAALSGVLSVASTCTYIRDTIRGETRPNAVSFILWTMFGAIALASQMRIGASWSAVAVALASIESGAIAIVALSGYGYKKFTTLNKVCFVVAICATALAELDPRLTILLVIPADAVVYAPILAKAWTDPQTEHWPSWVVVAISGVFGVLASDIVDVANLAFPIYLVAINSLITAVVLFRRSKVRGAARLT